MKWNLDFVVFWCLAVWALIFGICEVTNLEITWQRPIMGFSALILGIVCIVRNIAWHAANHSRSSP